MSWDAYKILTSSGSFKWLCLNNCSIKYSDGEKVTIDKLFENMHSVEKFNIKCSPGALMLEPDTVKKMIKILSGIKDIRSVQLSGIDENFDFISFMDFFTVIKLIL
uniref:Uncharacterized protein n=1 Tax=Panagrolaimus sp. ES5 TaxID=591445 RepID=A0AC34FNI9_9BILA